MTDATAELEQLVRQYVSLGKRSPKGYESCKCASCNDYKERGGFKFDPAFIHFSCFNCGASAAYSTGKSLSKKFKELLAAFGVPTEELDQVIGRAFLTAKASKATAPAASDKPLWSPPKTVPAPKGTLFDVLSDASPWCEVAREYLDLRGLTPHDAKFFVSDFAGDYKVSPPEPALEGRLIIPFMDRGRWIYWQARAMDASIEPRYINPSAEKEKIFYNYNELASYDKASLLYVTEGPLDAISIGPKAVSFTGSAMSEWHLGELKKAAGRGRRIVFVIDKNDNGHKLGKRALAQGWSVTVMPDNVDDANDGLKAHGRLWLMSHLASTAATGFAGELLLETKCVKKQTPSRKWT